MQTAVESVRLGWTAFLLPFLFVFSPNLLLQGDPLFVLGSVGTAMLGVWLTSMGVIAYARVRLSATQRLLYVVTGLALILPFDLFSCALHLNAAGAAAAGVLYYRSYRRAGRRVE